MSLATGRPAFKATLMALANNTDPDKPVDQALDEFLDALDIYIKSATVIVPGTGLIAGPYAVTGVSNTGELG